MNEKMKLRRRLYELDFAIYELTLFLDSHPESEKALRAYARVSRKTRRRCGRIP